MDILSEKHYDHTLAEPRWAAFWEEAGIYRYQPDNDRPVFSIDTPPPYASAAHLHVGHAMSYTQAEIIVRQRRMQGYNIFYPMGFDDNGLPTERFVEKKYNIDKSKISRREFIDLCLQETAEISKTYREFWQMLGLSVDWSLQFSTISPNAVRLAQASFLDLLRKGLAVRKEEPVMWDTALTTTLAQADIETIERQGTLYEIVFTAENGTPLTISTTRPELLPACVALFFHPDDPRYASLLGQQATVPLFGFSVPILADHTVSLEFGTGLMMVCTFGDGEDVVKWRTYELPTHIAITEQGRMNERAGEFAGLTLAAARKAIVEKLISEGYITGETPVTQHVNVAERSGTPVEFIPKLQWFITLLPHRQQFLQMGERLNWLPDFFRTRYDEWVNGLKWDWCISRQRFYGVSIPAWYCTACDAVIVAAEEQLPLDPTASAPPVDCCPRCGSDEFRTETDVFDTWMTSSLTPMLNADFHLTDGQWQVGRPGIYPMSVRVQAFEIIRTWLFYTIVKADYHTGQLPWRDAMISGWGLDAKGKKISKRHGNYQDPREIVERYSADSLRYWSALGSLGQDLRYNEEEVKKGRRLQMKLFNATKLLALSTGAGYRFTPPVENLLPVDRWLLAECSAMMAEVTERFERYDYANALRAIEAFFWATLCDNGLEMLKNRMRIEHGYTPEEGRTGCDVVFSVLLDCVKLFAPYIPFITEHVYQGYFRAAMGEDAPVSIHVSPWPEPLLALREMPELENGRLVLQAIHALRRAKTEQQLHIGAAVNLAIISAPAPVLAACQHFQREIASAIRATTVIFQESEYIVGKVSNES